MNWTRSITLLVAALIQVWPAWAAVPSSPSTPACGMSCCAWQADVAGTVCCGCVKELPRQTPATPPTGGRDLLPSVVLFETASTPFSPVPPPSVECLPWVIAPTLTTAPHVRLTVLHGAFLL